MKKLFTVFTCLILALCLALPLVACTQPHQCESVCSVCGSCTNASCFQDACATKCTCNAQTETKVTHTQWNILKDNTHAGKSAQTAVHKFVADKAGPRIAIVGGTHGDEVAGWTAALRLVDQISSLKGICGEILIIPQANIVADNACKRYVGESDVVNLNRVFPIGQIANANEEVVAIARAIIKVIEDFDPDYVVDLHESRGSWTDKGNTSATLGDTLIFSNEALFMDDLLHNYNENYRGLGEPTFAAEPAVKAGSFSLYFSTTYPDRPVFTVETNRNYDFATKTDLMPLETRVRQQLNILNSLFDLAWERLI